ncbi:hypothetical protein GALL_487680 [mine drainage metagenome]|uniref:Uncharacterized protein n=1 Tax=mine drainage metagenome TaxID=410659 RepID=A0A1J5PPC6_9ZZZZ
MSNHVRICVSIPSKHLVLYVVGHFKGKSDIDSETTLREGQEFHGREFLG